ncbi:hypothetical protein IPL68_06305 [Candidatus Saccharibacteria bacterium]|nr:MAG: hypothetical protein IPL68_06305 [Candidatus Saccharibacteria bacterium]
MKNTPFSESKRGFNKCEPKKNNTANPGKKAPADGDVNIIVSVGGDTTFNAAFAAAEGTNNVVIAMRAGNATNAAINLHRIGGRVLNPMRL